MLRLSPTALALLLVSAVGCGEGRHSPAGFRLPAYGDAERGKIAFATLRCHECHQVSGVEFPKPTPQHPGSVVLGGDRGQDITDGYLVTSIINPSHALANYRRDQITVSPGKSRMPEYADISVRQLTDLIAFLQSRYRTVRTVNGYAPYAYADTRLAR